MAVPARQRAHRRGVRDEGATEEEGGVDGRRAVVEVGGCEGEGGKTGGR